MTCFNSSSLWSSREKANEPELLPGARHVLKLEILGRAGLRRASQFYEATWPQQPLTDLQLNYTNTDPHGRKEISISCENRQTANHPLSFLFARLPSQQVANWHLVAILSIQLTITPRIPLLAEEGGDPRGGWTPRKGREYLWTPSHLTGVSVGLLPMVVFIVIKRK